MKLSQVQNIIADESFRYGGNSLEVIEVVNAIKAGKRLIDVESLKEQINEYREDCMKDAEYEPRCQKCNEICFNSIMSIIEG